MATPTPWPHRPPQCPLSEPVGTASLLTTISLTIRVAYTDLGYNDVDFQSPNHSVVLTPNLRDLATNGIRLANHHVQPFVSPCSGTALWQSTSIVAIDGPVTSSPTAPALSRSCTHGVSRSLTTPTAPDTVQCIYVADFTSARPISRLSVAVRSHQRAFSHPPIHPPTVFSDSCHTHDGASRAAVRSAKYSHLASRCVGAPVE